MLQYQHLLGHNLAPQKQVCTRVSVHPSECKPAPFIFAPFGFRFAPFGVLLWLLTWIFRVQNGHPHQLWCKFAPQRCSQCDNLGWKLEPLFFSIYLPRFWGMPRSWCRTTQACVPQTPSWRGSGKPIRSSPWIHPELLSRPTALALECGPNHGKGH